MKTEPCKNPENKVVYTKKELGSSTQVNLGLNKLSETFNAEQPSYEGNITDAAENSKRKSSLKFVTPEEAKENDVGEDGFNLYAAYFEDGNEKYYQVTFTSALNGDVETAYSIGNIRERRKPTSGTGSSARESSAQKGGKLSKRNVSQSSSNVKTEERIRTKKHSLKKYTPEERAQHVKDAVAYFGKIYLRKNEQEGYIQDRTKDGRGAGQQTKSGKSKTKDGIRL